MAVTNSRLSITPSPERSNALKMIDAKSWCVPSSPSPAVNSWSESKPSWLVSRCAKLAWTSLSILASSAGGERYLASLRRRVADLNAGARGRTGEGGGEYRMLEGSDEAAGSL